MRTGAIFIFSVFLYFSPLAQTAPTKYWIQFKNKNNTPYSLSSPLNFLSQKAIDRRTKQQITLDSTDLPIVPAYIAGIAAFDSVKLLNKSKWFNAVTIRTTDTNTLNIIKSLPYVKKTEAVGMIKWKDELENNYTAKNISNNISSDKVIEPLAYDYGNSFTQVHMLGVECMHNRGFDGKGMTIAVLDAGFYHLNVTPAFDSILNNNQILGTWDFVQGDNSVYEDYTHGMYVMSTMAANQPGVIVGTAPKAKYWLLRTEEAATEFLIEEDNWVAGAEFADSVGADIINSSLGYTEFDNTSQNHTYSDLDGNTTRITIGADLAAKKGILVVNSAGNSGASPWHYISAPADADSILTVGAVNANRVYASFSSVGPTADGRIKPNVAAMGEGAFFALNNGTAASGNGTSFSSPIMAGAVACLWQANPAATNMQLINAIQQSADQSSAPDNFLGYGIPNFCVANELLAGQAAEKFSTDNIVSIYPVPFENELSFSFFSNSKQDITVDLFDIRGRKITEEEKSVTGNSYTIFTINNLSDIAQGIYILKVNTPDKTFTEKVMKN
jgi:serine protease AprX